MLSAASLKSWPNLLHLDDEFLRKIKLVWAGPNNLAYVVTTDDDVFKINTNGTSDAMPQKIEALSQKRVVKLFNRGALTANGTIYGWGSNEFGQLGTGSTETIEIPTLIGGPLKQLVVTSLAFGEAHSVAVTKEGAVFAWGRNDRGQLGDGTLNNVLAPKQIKSCVGTSSQSFVAVEVACGQNFTILLLNSGAIISCGENTSGQLGLGSTTDQCVPQHVSALDGHTIQKIACGWNHVLALTSKGHLYGWGLITKGEMGSGETERYLAPQRIANDIGIISDFATFPCKFQIFALSSLAKKCYIWGEFKGQTVKAPIETPFKTLPEAFMFYNDCFPSTIEIAPGPLTLTDSFKMAFNQKELSDVTFMVDGQELFAHKSVLMIRCEHFRTLFKDCWQDADKPVEITLSTFPVFKAFLGYIYGEEVDLTKDDHLIELMDLANSYFEPALMHQCKERLKDLITVENATLLYAAALKYELKDLEKLSFNFTVNHSDKVVETEAYSKMDREALLAFLTEAGQKRLLKLKI